MARRRSTLAAWLLQLEPHEVTEILLARRDVAEAQARSLKAMAEYLTSPESIRAAVSTLDQGTLDVLAAVVSLGDAVTVTSLDQLLGCTRRELAELRRRALVWEGAGGALQMVNSLKPGGMPSRITPRPPAPRHTDRDTRPVDRVAAGSATSTVDGVTRLLEHCATEEIDARRYSGGCGTREVRRAATALHTSEAKSRLWIELAVEAQLLGIGSREDRLLPTAASVTWRSAHPGRRLVELIEAWQRMDWQPATEKPRSALLDHPGDAGAAIRREVLSALRRQPGALAETAELVAELIWLRPALHDRLATTAALAEAESLGLVAQGALTSLGRALDSPELGEVAERLLPPPTDVARLQADLTAVVSGLPTAELSALLNLVADADERDTASVWRFSAASVRRALDTGHTADQLLAKLSTVAEHDLPQPLRYLVNDVARRHGQLTVTSLACCVRAEEPALLTEIAGHSGLQGLRLRFLAPTVLASAKPAPDTLAALRAAGYAPTNVDVEGESIVERTETRWADARGRRRAEGHRYWREPMTDAEIGQLAKSLVEQERPAEQLARLGESPRLNNARLLRDQSIFLPDSEVYLLAEALVTSSRVEIRYANGPRRTVQHVITPLTHESGSLKAHCESVGDAREFLVSHIRQVTVPAD